MELTAKGPRKRTQTFFLAPGYRVHPGAFFSSRREPVAYSADRMDVPRGLRAPLPQLTADLEPVLAGRAAVDWRKVDDDRLIRVDYHGPKEVPAGTCHALLKAAGIKPGVNDD